MIAYCVFGSQLSVPCAWFMHASAFLYRRRVKESKGRASELAIERRKELFISQGKRVNKNNNKRKTLLFDLSTK